MSNRLNSIHRMQISHLVLITPATESFVCVRASSFEFGASVSVFASCFVVAVVVLVALDSLDASSV